MRPGGYFAFSQSGLILWIVEMMQEFRVWSDGTVQAVSDGEPFSHMSDDFLIVTAFDSDSALRQYSRWECCAA